MLAGLGESGTITAKYFKLEGFNTADILDCDGQYVYGSKTMTNYTKGRKYKKVHYFYKSMCACAEWTRWLAMVIRHSYHSCFNRLWTMKRRLHDGTHLVSVGSQKD